MTQTFNGDVFQYDISIDQQILKDLHVKQKHSHFVYTNVDKSFSVNIDKQLEYNIYIDQEVNFNLEN